MRLILFFRPIAYEKCDWNDVVLMKVSTVTAQSNVQVSSIVSCAGTPSLAQSILPKVFANRGHNPLGRSPIMGYPIHPTRIQNTQDFQYVCNQ